MPARDDLHWRTLRDTVDRLRLAQRRDGSVDLEAHSWEPLAHDVDRVATSVRGLADRFPHQQEYLDAVVADIGAWAASGFHRPDFTAALA
ncbi:MAG: DUF6421 family protein, partial [Solirubrobacteraceae bacterium]